MYANFSAPKESSYLCNYLLCCFMAGRIKVEVVSVWACIQYTIPPPGEFITFARFGGSKSETVSMVVAGSLWHWIESSSSYQWVSFKFNSFHSIPIYYVCSSTVYFDEGLGLGIGGVHYKYTCWFFADFDFCEM